MPYGTMSKIATIHLPSFFLLYLQITGLLPCAFCSEGPARRRQLWLSTSAAVVVLLSASLHAACVVGGNLINHPNQLKQMEFFTLIIFIGELSRAISAVLCLLIMLVRARQLPKLLTDINEDLFILFTPKTRRLVLLTAVCSGLWVLTAIGIYVYVEYDFNAASLRRWGDPWTVQWSWVLLDWHLTAKDFVTVFIFGTSVAVNTSVGLQMLIMLVLVILERLLTQIEHKLQNQTLTINEVKALYRKLQKNMHAFNKMFSSLVLLFCVSDLVAIAAFFASELRFVEPSKDDKFCNVYIARNWSLFVLVISVTMFLRTSACIALYRKVQVVIR